MASFPPDYTVLSGEDFMSYNLTPGEDSGLSVVPLLQIRNNGRAEDHFRLCIFGPGTVAANIPASRVLPVPESSGIVLQYSATPEDISPEVDSTTTNWLDIEDLLRDSTMVCVNAEALDVQIEAKEFRDMLRTGSSAKSPVGGSIRWAVAINAGGLLEMQLQALPAPAKLLHKYNLRKVDQCKYHMR